MSSTCVALFFHKIEWLIVYPHITFWIKKNCGKYCQVGRQHWQLFICHRFYNYLLTDRDSYDCSNNYEPFYCLQYPKWWDVLKTKQNTNNLKHQTQIFLKTFAPVLIYILHLTPHVLTISSFILQPLRKRLHELQENQPHQSPSAGTRSRLTFQKEGSQSSKSQVEVWMLKLVRWCDIKCGSDSEKLMVPFCVRKWIYLTFKGHLPREFMKIGTSLQRAIRLEKCTQFLNN